MTLTLDPKIFPKYCTASSWVLLTYKNSYLAHMDGALAPKMQVFSCFLFLFLLLSCDDKISHLIFSKGVFPKLHFYHIWSHCVGLQIFKMNTLPTCIFDWQCLIPGTFDWLWLQNCMFTLFGHVVTLNFDLESQIFRNALLTPKFMHCAYSCTNEPKDTFFAYIWS